MIPLCDVMPSRTRPVSVLSLGAIQIAAFLVAVLAGAGSAPPGRSWFALGAAPGSWTWIGVAGGLLLHPNSVLFAANIAATWIFGGTVEDRLGHGRVVALWLAGGLAATAAHVAAAPDSVALLLGATGGAAAIVAANLALYPRGRVLAAWPVVVGIELIDLPSWSYACLWAAVVFAALVTAAPAGTAAAGAAGLCAGAVGARLLRRPERMTVDWWDGASVPNQKFGDK
jgi:membrane associated rhomboid family serine protease